MSAEIDIWSTTAVAAGGLAREAPSAAAVELRADILGMTQTAEDAVLRPVDPGCWPHALRLTLAARMARLTGAEGLAQRYLAMLQPGDQATLAEVDSDAGGLTPAMAAAVTFTDRVAARPRDATADDIRILQNAGICDADIVKLTELIAFIAYQSRLVIGLSLLSGDKS